MTDQKKKRRFKEKPMTQEEYDELASEEASQSEFDEEFQATEKELAELDRKQLILLIMELRERTSNFSHGLTWRYLTPEKVKEMIVNSFRGKQKRAEGRTQKAQKYGSLELTSKELGVDSFYEFMKEVIRRMDDPKSVVSDSLKTDTAKARAIALDLLTKESMSSISKSHKEWQLLINKHIGSGNIRTARKQLKTEYRF
jgi:hypothetical protein